MNGTSLQKEHKVTTKLYFFTLIIIYRKIFPKITVFTGTVLGTVKKTLKMTDFVAGTVLPLKYSLTIVKLSSIL